MNKIIAWIKKNTLTIIVAITVVFSLVVSGIFIFLDLQGDRKESTSKPIKDKYFVVADSSGNYRVSTGDWISPINRTNLQEACDAAKWFNTPMGIKEEPPSDRWKPVSCDMVSKEREDSASKFANAAPMHPIEIVSKGFVLATLDTSDVLTIYHSKIDTAYMRIYFTDSVHVETNLPLTEAAELLLKRLRELSRSQLAVGDSVAVICYSDGVWAGNYFGRIVKKNWTTDRYFVRSTNILSPKFDYQWIDAANLEKMP